MGAAATGTGAATTEIVADSEQALTGRPALQGACPEQFESSSKAARTQVAQWI